MKRSTLTTLLAPLLLFTSGCLTVATVSSATGKLGIQEQVDKAECDYSALYVESNYKWTVSLYTEPVGGQIGKVMPSMAEVFCVDKNDIHRNRLHIRIRSQRNPDRQSGAIAHLENVEKGEVWNLQITSPSSLQSWAFVPTPYTVD